MTLHWFSVVTSWLVIVSTSVISQHSYVGVSMRRYMRLPDEAETLWFDQKLDHLHSDKTSTTWKQRYSVNLNRYQEGGSSPIFFKIGGEGPEPRLHCGFWNLLAVHFGAVQFDLEHRFYGKSIPTDDLSTKNLRYLNVEQALGDLTNFIVSMNSKYNFTSSNKWVVFGGSYSGMLSAWARLKFPKIVHAAVSSSAPVQLELSFKEFNEVVRTVLAAHDKKCAENVHRAALQLSKLLPNPRNKKMLMEKFKACEYDAKNNKDVVSFLDIVARSVQNSVQHNHSKFVCDFMMNETLGDPLERYGQLFQNVLMLASEPNNHICAAVRYQEHISSLMVKGGDPNERSWMYQRCNELGGWPTSSTSGALFGSRINLQYFVDICKDVFGPEFDLERLNKATKHGDLEYEGRSIKNNVTRVIFVQGSNDPLYPQGVCNSTNPQAPAIMIQGTAHSDDKRYPTLEDIKPLVDARRKITMYIQEWLH